MLQRAAEMAGQTKHRWGEPPQIERGEPVSLAKQIRKPVPPDKAPAINGIRSWLKTILRIPTSNKAAKSSNLVKVSNQAKANNPVKGNKAAKGNKRAKASNRANRMP